MSLLMQALKKAEQAKQTAVPAVGPSEEEGLSKAVSLSEISLLPIEAIGAAPAARNDSATAAGLDEMQPVPEQESGGAAQVLLELAPISAPGGEDAAGKEPTEQAPVPVQQEPISLPAQPETVSNAAPQVPAAAAPDAELKNPAPAAPPRPEQLRAAAQDSRNAAAAKQRAKSVFTSKQDTGKWRTVAIAGGVAAVAILGLGLWYLNASGVFQTSTVTPAGVAVAPAPLPAAVTEPAQPQAAPLTPATAVPAAPVETKQATVETAPPAAPTNAGVSAQSPAAPNVESRPPAQAQTQTQAVEYAIEQPGIQFRRTAEIGQVNASLSQAYQAYMAGDFGAAEQKYRRALQQEPNSRDALLGLAAIALKRQQKDMAAAWFLKLLEADPTDPDAGAGLVSLQHGDFVHNESRLKKILALHPGSGAIQFALGNLYSQQARWGEAQQAYFQAYSSAPGNADYAFNLAVSLDRLNQPKLALEYYQRALKLVAGSQGSFSAESVLLRVKELQAAAGE